MGPAPVIIAVGTVFTVTPIVFEVAIQMLFETTQVKLPEAFAIYDDVVAPEIFAPFNCH